MTIALIILGAIALALIADRVIRERAHDAERARLLSRIQAPAAAQVAAFAAAVPSAPLIDTDAEDDRRFGEDVLPDADLALTSLGDL